MRLNRGTLALILLSAAAIALVLVINASQVNAPADATVTPGGEQAGPLFASIDVNTLARLEIIENGTGSRTVLTRTTGAELASATVVFVGTQEPLATEDALASSTDEADTTATDEVLVTEDIVATDTVDTVATQEENPSATDEIDLTEEAIALTDEISATATIDPLVTPTATIDPAQPVWVISEASILTERSSDITQTQNAVAVFGALQKTTQFEGESAANFNLDQPRYTLIGTAEDGTTYRVDVGRLNPTAPRYYVLLNGDAATVYQVQSDQLDSLINLVTTPPYLPSPTPTLFPSNTPNPYSEVEQTQTAVIEGTVSAQTQAAADAASQFMFTPVVTPSEP